MRWYIRHSVVLVTAMLAAACGSGATGTAGDGGAPKLTITSPANDATVQMPFTLTYESSVQLGPPESGRDHVHVFADGKTDQYTVVPTTSFQIKDLTPGRHTIGVTLQHADHSPAGASAEITVTVASGGAPTTGPTSGDSGGYGY
jgi:hypothetical protein